ncbi:hypothetical protein EYF80_026599 [Liparis tanakae]|uniref:Uncharacterized protein n=1 Tax=Liparis tanakae TaxID=230148 RepID=A0A4Z2HCZ6_9TELE|nr:hypothetical protein EYF80_026599 [Liparis tanakae]
MIGHRPIVIILEVLLQSHGVPGENERVRAGVLLSELHSSVMKLCGGDLATLGYIVLIRTGCCGNEMSDQEDVIQNGPGAQRGLSEVSARSQRGLSEVSVRSQRGLSEVSVRSQ